MKLFALALFCAPALVCAAGMKLNPTRDLAFDQLIDKQVPMDLTFLDETGRRVTLGQLSRGKPTALALVYYSCQNICGVLMDGLSRSFANVERFTAGKDFNVITVSIDPREKPATAAPHRQRMLQRYGRSGADAGWHCLTGDEASIKALAEAIGFKYSFDDSSGQFLHPAGIVLLTPDGRLARYFYGVDYSARDLTLGLVESSQGKIGTVIDQALLFCYGYDAHAGKYTLLVMRIMRVAGLFTIAILGTFLAVMFRRERKARA